MLVSSDVEVMLVDEADVGLLSITSNNSDHIAGAEVGLCYSTSNALFATLASLQPILSFT